MVKVGFVTCVKLGLSCMEAIYEAGGELNLVMTLLDSQAKSKSGRVYLDEFCDKFKVPLIKSSHINNSDVIHALKSADLDWLFVIGWSQIASEELLNVPKKGVLGMHPTLLPIGRGRASIPWAIIKGLSKTGVTLFKLDSEVDTGEIVDQVEIELTNEIDATQLYSQVEDAHVSLIHKVIPNLIANKLELYQQNESQATVWPGRKPEDGLIDFDDSVNVAERLIRALSKPYPGAFFFENRIKFIVWKARIVYEEVEGCKYINFKDGKLLLIDWSLDESK